MRVPSSMFRGTAPTAVWATHGGGGKRGMSTSNEGLGAGEGARGKREPRMGAELKGDIARGVGGRRSQEANSCGLGVTVSREVEYGLQERRRESRRPGAATVMGKPFSSR